MKKSSETLRRMLAIALCVTTLGSAGIMTEAGSFVGTNITAEAASYEIYTYNNITYALYSDGTATAMSYDGTNKDFSTSSFSIPSVIYASNLGKDYILNYSQFTVTKLQAGGFSGIKARIFGLPNSLQTVLGGFKNTEIGVFAISTNNSSFSTSNGFLSNKSGTEIVAYPSKPSLYYTSDFIYIPSTVTSIGMYAFTSYNATSITIPSSVTYVGRSAFQYSSLQSITFEGNPSFYQASGESVCSFDDATSLSSITIKGTSGNYSTDGYGMLYNKDKTKFIYCPMGKTGAFNVADTCTEIVDWAFHNSSAKPVIYDNVTKISSIAFDGVKSGFKLYCLKDTDIETFAKNNSLNYGYHFEYTINSDNTVTVTKYSGPYSSPSLPNTVKGKTITAIGAEAFKGNTSLSAIYISSTKITSIGDSAFYGCTKLKNIYLPSTVTSIGKKAFYNTIATSITIPSSMTEIGEEAFYGMFKLEKISIPSKVTKIGTYAFGFDSALTSVAIPNAVTQINFAAFYGCSNLTSMTIGSGVKTIGGSAFCNTGLTSQYIPKTVTSIGSYAFGFNYANSTYTKVSGFSITGYAYTAADTYAANNNITFNPKYETLANNTAISKNAIKLGDSITINFNSTGGKKPITYAAMYSLNGGSSVSICTYSTNTSTTFTPTKAGTYTIYTYAKDDRGQFVAKTFTLTVDTPAVQNTSTISTTSINAGDNIAVNASATGGNGSYQYSAAYRDVNTSTWTTVQLLGSNSNINFTIPASGKYEVSVQAADTDGKKEYKYFTVTVYDKLVNASEINAETAIVGDEIIINASATGGSGGYTYKFSYTRDGISYWADATSSDVICTFIPNYADTYHYKVVVTDSNGKTDEKVFDVVVEEPQRELVNTSTVSDTEITLGNRVYVTPSAEGGAGNYTYAVLYKKKTDTKWVTKQNFSANTENISVLPSMAADYEICVKVQDGDGNIVKKFFEVKVLNAVQPLTNNSTLSSLTITKGETITVTASAQGGEGDYLYQVVYKKKTDTKWATAQNFAANNVVTIKPASAVDYDVCVKVKDAKGDIVKKFFDVTVTAAVELTNNSIMSASTIVKGNTVTLTGIAAGGSGSYTYAFLYKKKTDTKWTTKQGFAENNTVDIKPASAVDYDVCIKVQDSKGTIVKKFFDLTVTQALASNSTISATSITKGQTVTVNCAATGGEAPYAYAVYYKKNADTKWTTKQNFTDNAEVIVKPANATTYDICVKVKDCTGTVAKQYFTVEVK